MGMLRWGNLLLCVGLLVAAGSVEAALDVVVKAVTVTADVVDVVEECLAHVDDVEAYHLPNICDCHTFYTCTVSGPEIEVCPDDLLFHPELQVCVYKENYTCPTIPEECNVATPNTTRPITDATRSPRTKASTTLPTSTAYATSTTKTSTTSTLTATPDRTVDATTMVKTTKSSTPSSTTPVSTSSTIYSTPSPSTSLTSPTTTTTTTTEPTSTTTTTTTTTTAVPTTTTRFSTTTSTIPTTTTETTTESYVQCSYINEIIPDLKDCHMYFICTYDSYHTLYPVHMVSTYTCT